MRMDPLNHSRELHAARGDDVEGVRGLAGREEAVPLAGRAEAAVGEQRREVVAGNPLEERVALEDLEDAGHGTGRNTPGPPGATTYRFPSGGDAGGAPPPAIAVLASCWSFQTSCVNTEGSGGSSSR